jgi:hypothetical protein
MTIRWTNYSPPAVSCLYSVINDEERLRSTTVLRPWFDEEVVVGEMKVGVVRDQDLKRNLARTPARTLKLALLVRKHTCLSLSLFQLASMVSSQQMPALSQSNSLRDQESKS